MAIERTFSMIKPNAVTKNIIGAICHRLERAGLHIIAIKMMTITREQAEGFYVEHRGKAFFTPLIDFITSGPIVVQVLEGENGIYRYRDLMGATDPKQATTGTLRADYGDNLTKNAVHGSDSVISAKREIAYFFDENEIYLR